MHVVEMCRRCRVNVAISGNLDWKCAAQREFGPTPFACVLAKHQLMRHAKNR